MVMAVSVDGKKFRCFNGGSGNGKFVNGCSPKTAKAELLIGMSSYRFSLVVGAACFCSFCYVLLLVLTAQPCRFSSSLTFSNPFQCRGEKCNLQEKNLASAQVSNDSFPSFHRPDHEQGSALKALSALSIIDLETESKTHRNGSASASASSSNESSSASSSHSDLAMATDLGRDPEGAPYKTSLDHIVFGIAASAKLWPRRKEYVKMWWRPDQMRGFVWLDKTVKGKWSNALYPPYKISGSVSKFNYSNKRGSRSAIRISRIVSETYRIGLKDVHWFVMGDDDTIFIPENLVGVLSKYDHRKLYYIGSNSESHTQNLHFSYNMAYGGGGFAISYPLAMALEKMQDSCLHRYPYLFGSDDRMQACLSELGIPLTKEPGFHQFDIYGDASGLLTAHPVAPLVSIHHLDVIDPLFPNMTQVQSLQHLRKAIRIDPAGIIQQSICYDKWRKWSFSVSWGYAVQVFRGILPPRELELPARTFMSWYRRTEDSGYPFSTRAVSRNSCEQPAVFYMDRVSLGSDMLSSSTYMREARRRGDCKWRMASPAGLDWIRVVKQPTDGSWHEAPRRQCCTITRSNRKNVEITLGACAANEIIA